MTFNECVAYAEAQIEVFDCGTENTEPVVRITYASHSIVSITLNRGQLQQLISAAEQWQIADWDRQMAEGEKRVGAAAEAVNV